MEIDRTLVTAFACLFVAVVAIAVGGLALVVSISDQTYLKSVFGPPVVAYSGVVLSAAVLTAGFSFLRDSRD